MRWQQYMQRQHSLRTLWVDGKETYLDGATSFMSRLETLLNTMKCTRHDEFLCKERTLSTQEIMSELLNE